MNKENLYLLHSDEQDEFLVQKLPFVFGSSTQREFSYLLALPHELRVYDAKVTKCHRSRVEELQLTRKHLAEARCHSSSPKRCPASRRGKSAECRLPPSQTTADFVFGSSTPRSWSYLGNLPRALTVYDAELSPHRRRRKRPSQTPADFIRATGISQSCKSGSSSTGASTLWLDPRRPHLTGSSSLIGQGKATGENMSFDQSEDTITANDQSEPLDWEIKKHCENDLFMLSEVVSELEELGANQSVAPPILSTAGNVGAAPNLEILSWELLAVGQDFSNFGYATVHSVVASDDVAQFSEAFSTSVDVKLCCREDQFSQVESEKSGQNI